MVYFEFFFSFNYCKKWLLFSIFLVNIYARWFRLFTNSFLTKILDTKKITLWALKFWPSTLAKVTSYNYLSLLFYLSMTKDSWFYCCTCKTYKIFADSSCFFFKLFLGQLRLFANLTMKDLHLHTNILVIFNLLPFIGVKIDNYDFI